MDKIIEKLHISIRRYCIENSQFWRKKYFELTKSRKSDNDYTDEAYSVFPKYNALDAILIEIERFQPNDFSNFEEAKEFFCLISKEANSIFTKPPNNEIAEKVQNEEREKLCEFINNLNEIDLEKVKPLFYRKVLSEKESESLRKKLSERWSVDGYWFPLSVDKPENTEAFIADHFENDFGFEKLRQIVSELKIKRVFEVNENNINYEIEISVFEPYYSGSEGFWFDESFDWLIYASHENSITFAGSILPKIKESWISWQNHLWENW